MNNVYGPLKQRSGLRQGLTLIELLVVIAVIAAVAGIAIPSVKFLNKDQRIREATRVVNSFITTAQSASISGTPTGIWIQRDPLNPRFAYRLYRVRAPQPYTGDGNSSRVVIQWIKDSASGTVFWFASFDKNDSSLVFLMAKRGELAGRTLRFGYNQQPFEVIQLPGTSATDSDFVKFLQRDPLDVEQKRWRVAIRIPVYFDQRLDPYPRNDNPALATGGFPPAQRVNTADANNAHEGYARGVTLPNGADVAISRELPYEIERLPIRLTSGSVQLPRSTRIDLKLSGVGAIGREFAWFDRAYIDPNTANSANLLRPVVIMFAPDGSIGQIYYDEPSLAQNATSIAVKTPSNSLHLFLITDETFDDANAALGADVEADDLDIDNVNTPFDKYFKSLGATTNGTPFLTNLDKVNLSTASNRWISISRGTGAVTTAENADQTLVQDIQNVYQRLNASRRFAREGVSSGGS